MNNKWMKTSKSARDAIMMQILLAFEQQRDEISDSDLDDEQPISLRIQTRLGFIRKARHLYGADHDS